MFNTAQIIEKIEFFDKPAFVYDENKILNSIKLLKTVSAEAGCNVLFPLKSFSIVDALIFMSQNIDGFSASSLFEAKLAREILGSKKAIHITTPGLRSDEIEVISELVDYLSFNSLSQWKQYQNMVGDRISLGLRINPQVSFVKDDRYNPCKKHSKLGIPLDNIKDIIESNSNSIHNIKGIHFHTNCESMKYDQLLKTVKHIDRRLSNFLQKLDWINLGGGYLFERDKGFEKLIEAIIFLKDRYEIEVFLEPGKAIVGNAGYIISTIIDIFESDGKNIAILDTTVNHMPEVFEYQYKPDILQESLKGKYIYILAGATCLAGDLFGEYRFDAPLDIGSHIIFKNMGAYTLVKAHMFNGVNLPTIYSLTLEGNIELKKQFDYSEYKLRCGVN